MRGEVNERLGERICCEEMPGGLSLYILPKKGFRQKSALLAVDFGAIDRRLADGAGGTIELPAGTAHFLEHRMFHKPEGDITERFSVLGAEVDANTTFVSTTFSFTGIDFFAKNLELLLELAFRPHLTEEGMEREREIVSREVRLFADSMEWVSYFSALGTIYPGQPLATDIAGTLESIERIDRDLLERCYRSFYQPANAGLYICGDVDVAAVRECVAGWLGEREFPPIADWRSVPRQVLEPADPVSMEASLPVVRPHQLLAFQDRRAGLSGEVLLRREMALELALDILFGPGSLFFSERYEQGLIDASSFGFEVTAEPFFSACLIGGDSQYPERLEQAIVGELHRSRSEWLIRRDFDRAMRKTYGHLLTTFDQVENCVQLMHGAVSCGAMPFDYLKAHERLRVDDVLDCLDTCLDARRYGLSRLWPLDPESEP